MTALDAEQVEHWRALYEQEQADSKWVVFHRERDQRRQQVRMEMLEFLQSYVQGEISTEEFRAIFQSKTGTTWDVFGLKGLSGAMLLNQFVKNVPDQDELTALLRQVLPVPAGEQEGRNQLSALVDYVHELLAAHVVAPLHLQAARIPFFVSAWWHLQEPEQWPVYYVSGRQILDAEGLFTPTQDPVADYFAFRSAFLTLATTLGFSSWTLEHLLSWCRESKKTPTSPGPEHEPGTDGEPVSVVTPVPPEEAAGAQPPETQQQVKAHTQVQLLLAKIGKELGCSVWIAANDHGRLVDGGKLGDWSIGSLPTLGLDANTQKIISLIDVLWLKGAHHVVAAFEIEHTTSIYSGLLRMSDLVAMAPMLNIPLYIVSPAERLKDVRRELSRPTFQALGLHERCGYFSEEALKENAKGIMTWADDPGAIKRLAQYVSDVMGGEME